MTTPPNDAGSPLPPGSRPDRAPDATVFQPDDRTTAVPSGPSGPQYAHPTTGHVLPVQAQSSYPGYARPGPAVGYPGQAPGPAVGHPFAAATSAAPAGGPLPGVPAYTVSTPGSAVTAPGYPPAPVTVPPGYPQYPTAAGYPGYSVLPAPPEPPGLVRAAAVLAFVQGGLILLGGIGTLSGSQGLRDVGLRANFATGSLTVMGAMALVAGALFIGGGVQLFHQRSTLLVVAAALSIALSAWWILQFDFFGLILVWSLTLMVLPILCLTFVLGADGRAWTKRPV